MSLHNKDLIGEYTRRHSPIWPELERTLIEHGVRHYSIFFHASTAQLFGYVEIEDETRWQAISQTDVCKRWWKDMSEFVVSTNGTPIAETLPEAFHLSSETSSARPSPPTRSKH